MEDQKAYYEIITAVWRLFRDSLKIAKTVKDPADPRWIQICEKFEAIEKDVPPEYKWYAGSMALLQVDTLERMWRK